MEWTKENLESKSKEELIEIILNFQEDFVNDFFPGLDDEVNGA